MRQQGVYRIAQAEVAYDDAGGAFAFGFGFENRGIARRGVGRGGCRFGVSLRFSFRLRKGRPLRSLFFLRGSGGSVDGTFGVDAIVDSIHDHRFPLAVFPSLRFFAYGICGGFGIVFVDESDEAVAFGAAVVAGFGIVVVVVGRLFGFGLTNDRAAIDRAIIGKMIREVLSRDGCRGRMEFDEESSRVGCLVGGFRVWVVGRRLQFWILFLRHYSWQKLLQLDKQ